MVEDDPEKIRITTRQLITTIACCRTMTDLDDGECAELIYESVDYLIGFQMMAYEALLKIQDDVSAYGGATGQFTHVFLDTDKLRVLKQPDSKPYRAKMLYDYAFSRYKTEFEVETERYESTKAKKYTAFYLGAKTVDEIISKLYWIMKPEVVFTGNLNQMAYEALCRSRLRARDILNRLSAEMPCPEYLRDFCFVGVVEARELQPVLDLRRDWPGKDSEDFF